MLVVKKKVNQEADIPSIKGITNKVLLEFINRNIDQSKINRKVVLSVDNNFSIENLANPTEFHENFSSIINLRKANEIRNLTSLFCAVNNRLDVGGDFVTCVETTDQRKNRLFSKYPKGINKLYYTLDYIGKRIIPKLPILKNIYFFLTAGRNRVLTSVEIMGRLAYCGFKIKDTERIDNRLYISCEKVENKINLPELNYGVLFKMNRTGLNGKIIQVYKVRSMHAYSEYLQDHIYETNNLADGGKIKDDYRVNYIGKISRKLWLDELPMIYNLIKGDIKLFGVRPLSKQYLGLYNLNIIKRRRKFKPGLIPPFYADMPNTIEEIMDSEMRYFDAYEKNPFTTDIKYFFKAFKNIVIKKRRSK